MIFARRTLQRRLDELRATFDSDAVVKLAARLNRPGKDRIAAMWEVAVLHALSKCGPLRNEAPLSSGRRSDVSFDNGALRLIADITSVSDEGLDDDNPYFELSERIEKAKTKLGLPIGGVDLRVKSRHHRSARGTRTVLSLPPRKQLDAFVRDQVVPQLRAQMDAGENLLQIAIDDDEVGLDITIDPLRSPYSSGSFAAYNVPKIKDRNPLYNALKAKAVQLRGAEGVTGVIVGDGDCAALAHRPLQDAPPSPSSNCSYARAADELLICGDPDLRRAAGAMGEEFARLRDRTTPSLRDRLVIDQRAWSARKNQACGITPKTLVTAANRGQFVSCLAQQIKARNDELSAYGSGASPPEYPAHAAGTTTQHAPEAVSSPTRPSATEAKTDTGATVANTRDARNSAPDGATDKEETYVLPPSVIFWGMILGAVITFIWYKRKRERDKVIARREHLTAKYGDAGIADKIMQHLIWPGMSEEQLVDSWGSPVDKAQRIYKSKITETFKYNQTGRNRFANRIVVENGIVVGWDRK
jgi:uncharacterized protein YecT (DUF1311 family)